MSWILKRTLSVRRFFEHPKHMLKIMGRKDLQFYTEFFVYLNLCINKGGKSGSVNDQ